MSNVTAYVKAAIVGTLVCTGCGGAGLPSTTSQAEANLIPSSQVPGANDGSLGPGSTEGEGTTAEGAPAVLGRMTGGGRLRNAGLSVSHGFELHCAVADPRQSLEVNWNGHRFHLTELTATWCASLTDVGGVTGGAGFDTIMGEGVGRLDGVDGARIQFVFTDAGEPGRVDPAGIAVVDAKGDLSLNIYGTLTFGNQQAHKDTPAP